MGEAILGTRVRGQTAAARPLRITCQGVLHGAQGLAIDELTVLYSYRRNASEILLAQALKI
jgi:hypothetical protein